jgi:hypothetical protein
MLAKLLARVEAQAFEQAFAQPLEASDRQPPFRLSPARCGCCGCYGGDGCFALPHRSPSEARPYYYQQA